MCHHKTAMLNFLLHIICNKNLYSPASSSDLMPNSLWLVPKIKTTLRELRFVSIKLSKRIHHRYILFTDLFIPPTLNENLLYVCPHYLTLERLQKLSNDPSPQGTHILVGGNNHRNNYTTL